MRAKEILNTEPKGIVLLPCPFCGADGEMLSVQMTKRSERGDTRKWPQGANCIAVETKRKKHCVAGVRSEETVNVYIYQFFKYTACCSNKSCIARKTHPDCNEARTAAARWNRRAGR